MAKLPEFQAAKLSLFNNSDLSIDNVDELMSTHKRVIAKLEIDNKKFFGQVWSKFNGEKSIMGNLTIVLKDSAKFLSMKNKVQLGSDPKSNKALSAKIRRAHAVWMTRAIRVDDILLAYHSCLVDVNYKPVGFISMVLDGNKVTSYITQNINEKAKHMIISPSIVNNESSSVRFMQPEFNLMVKYIDDINNK